MCCCSIPAQFVRRPEEKVFHQLGRWKLLKEKNPDLIIGVGGCVASQEGDHIRQRAHYVDIIFGPQTLHRLPEMINSVRGNRSPVVDISFRKLKNSIACQSRAPKGRPPLSRLWKVAINTAPTAWCRIPAEKKLAVRATISCLKSPSWRRRVCVRSICWGRTLTPGAVRITTAPPAALPTCCARSPPSTASTAFASPPATRSNLPTISSTFIAIRRSW